MANQFSKTRHSKKTFDKNRIMNVKLSLLFSFFLLFHRANAFNITLVLSQFPELSSFSSYLTKTNLAGDINSRQTITVLAVDNTVLSSHEGTSLDVLKKILSIHVLLDYFDVPKLQNLANNSAVVTTLFQTTGLAKGLQGFVNVTKLSKDTVAFGSAIPGSKLGSNLVKLVVSHPSNLSVLQVSGVIIPQGIDGTSPSPSPSKPPSNSPTISPTISPTPSVSPITTPPTSAPPTAPPTPSQAPVPSNAPSNAEAPTPGSPPIPNEPPADAPTVPAPGPNSPADTPPGPNSPADTPPGAGTALRHNYGLVFSVMCWAWLSLSS